jgi:hypothetical protein
LDPSPEAVEWGKRQAAKAPRWTDSKWNRIATIFDVTYREPRPDDQSLSQLPNPEAQYADQDPEAA